MPLLFRRNSPRFSLRRFLLLRWLTFIVLVVCTQAVAAEQPGTLKVATEDLADSIQLDAGSMTQQEHNFVINHPTLRVAVSATSALPYQTVEDGVISGYAIRFLRSVAAANGFRLAYQIYPSMEEVLEALEAREADITPMAGITDRRQQYLEFTSGITPNPTGLIGRTSDSSFAQAPHLRGKRVAVTRGSAAELYLSSQFPLAILVKADSTAQALNMISEDFSDYYYGSLTEVFFDTGSSLTSDLEIKQRVFYSTGWNHIAIRSDWPTVARLFDKYSHNTRNFVDSLLTESDNNRTTDAAPPLSLSSEEVVYLSALEKLRVATVDGAPLLNDVDSHGHHVGVSSEFTAYVSYQLGLPVELHPFKTVELMLEALAAGTVDISPYFAITEERQRTLLFSDPYLLMPWLVVGSATGTRYWDLGSLRGKSLALRKKHPLAPFIAEAYPGIAIRFTDTANESMAAVVSGVADATIETKLYINRSLTQYYAGLLQVLGEVTESPGAFAFAVHPRNELLIPVLNKALERLDPEFVDRVIRRWVAVDFEPERQLRSVLKVLVPTIAALTLFLLGSLYWNRRVHKENQQRLAAERRLIDMTDRLQTGVFQFRQYAKQSPVMEFSSKLTRHMARVSDDDKTGHQMGFFDYIDSEDRESVIKRLSYCLGTGEHFRESFRFNYPNGDKGWILSDATCRQEPDGARVWSGYLFDLTSERLMSEELNAALMERDEFMSMASHELRTPLQNISMALQSIDRKDLNPHQLTNLGIASSATNDLDELVSDILHLTSMQHHSAVLATEVVELHDLLHTICHGFKSVAHAKHLPFKLQIDIDVPQSVLGDSLRIKQILYNIIGNAIKYTEMGSVTVSVSIDTAQNDTTGSVIHFAVVDTGIGIPQADLERVFEPFATVGPASMRSSGLGLTLSQRLVAVMGGSIEVTSVDGEGSTFNILLPLHETNASSTHNGAGPDAALWNEQSESILVVDDNLLVRETLAALLSANGWRVLQAESALEALQMTQNVTFKALITDQRMPGMSGLELAHGLRQRYGDIEARPVLILMSGGLDNHEAAKATEVFDAMLFKPIKVGSVTKVVNDVIKGQSHTAASALNA